MDQHDNCVYSVSSVLEGATGSSLHTLLESDRIKVSEVRLQNQRQVQNEPFFMLQLYISSQCCAILLLGFGAKTTRFAKIPVLVATIEDGDGPLKDSRFRSPQK